MKQLSCGQRLVRCLSGQEVDRVPFGVGLGWYPWGSTVRRWRQESGNPQLDIGKELGYERGFVVPDVKFGIWPEFERKVIEKTPEYEIVRNERGIVTRQISGSDSMPEWLDYPVKSADDWDRLKKEHLDPNAPGRIPQDWDAFRACLQETGEAVQVGIFPWGVFGTPRDFLGVEELLMGFYEQPDLIRDMMDHLTTLWLSVYQRVAAEVQIDHIHIWEDMSGRQGSLISPQMVRDFMMPCYRRIVDFAKAHKVRLISVDTDGDCAQLMPVFMEHGVNAMMPFEVQAGNDIRLVRRQYPALGIMFGLDKRALALGRAEIDQEVEKAREMIASGRYLPGFDHLIPPDVSWDNFRYAAGRLREVCHNP